MIAFIEKKINVIRKYGIIVIFRKALILWTSFLALLAVPAVIIIRLLKPFVIIRFGPLRSERIGHFAGNTELYLCQRDLGMYDEKCLDVFYYSGRICNFQLKKMVERTLNVCWVAKFCDMANKWLPGKNVHSVFVNVHRDTEGLLAKTRPHFYFTKDEETYAKKSLKVLGISEDAPFVCIYARDSAYLNKVFGDRRNDWGYHDYRNADIKNYILAAKRLVNKGYHVVRIGNVVEKPLGIQHPKIIDYALSNKRSDLLDMYLSAKCHIFLGTNAGIYEIPRVFRRPVACVNLISLDTGNLYYLFSGSVFIPKKLWSRKMKRLLTFKEMIDMKVSSFFDTLQFEEKGIDIIENTEEEIKDLAIEMDGRLGSTWQTSKEDEILQNEYWSIVPWREFNKGKSVRIGSEFLKQNQELLA